MEPAPATVEFDRAGRHQTVYVVGELDAASAPGIRSDIVGHIMSTDDVLWVDLSGVTFCGSAGISMLCSVRERAEKVGVLLRLHAPPPHLTRLIELCGLTASFRVWSNSDA